MRILVVHRYYWPDKSPCASIMSCVAGHLASKGHQVDALSSQPSYRESSLNDRRPKHDVVDGVNVHRLLLPSEAGKPIWRVLNALHLGFWIIFKAVAKKYDVIIVATVPPVLGGFFSALAAKLTRGRFIYYCMDLHPEVGRVSGDFANPMLFSLLQRIDDWSCRKAVPILVHSEDMRKALCDRPLGHEYNIQIMNNFALPSDDLNDEGCGLFVKGNRLTVIYAGNVGRFQGLETVVEAMCLIAARKDIALVIMGDGVAKAGLIERANLSNANIQFIDYQPVGVAKSAIQQADIGLVTLIPNMYKYAYPSKTMAYLEQGTPIIAAIEANSELSRDMQSQDYGFSVPIGDARALAKLLTRLADDDGWRPKMSAAALQAFEKNFAADVVLERWERVVENGSTAINLK